MEGYADNNDDENDGDFDNDGISGTDFNGNDCDDTDANIGIAESGYDCDGNCLVDTDGDGICDQFETAGCTDATACNYDA